MSMTEQGLSPETMRIVERIRELSRGRRYRAAQARANRASASPSPAPATGKPKPAKARKPYFYNPASRD